MSLNACRDISLAVNTGKTKYMEIGRHRCMTVNEHIYEHEDHWRAFTENTASEPGN
jgi:hypothetical protein